MRLRTIPLAISSILMGSFLSAADGLFRWEVLLFASMTAIFLQVLSNLANDYGDSIHGADSADREGPSRSVQTGAISASTMKSAIAVFAVLSLCSGIALIFLSDLSTKESWLFFGLGLAAIAAAYYYTNGSRPYGYSGLGDISVFLFFGMLGVLGTYYLHTGSFGGILILPAMTVALFSVAVLNVNNIRDMVF